MPTIQDQKDACDAIYAALATLSNACSNDPANGPLVNAMQSIFAPLNANIQAAWQASGQPGAQS